MPGDFYVPIQIIFLFSNIIILISLLTKNNFILNSQAFFFSFSLFLLALIVAAEKGIHWTIPFYYLTSYISYLQFKRIGNIQSKLEYLIYSTYIYFIIIYFSKLPSLINRIDFNENVFPLSSSNSISIILNVYLLLYILHGVYINKLNYKKIKLFGLINIVLIFIQQSRIGLLVAIIILIIPFIQNLSKSSIKKYTYPTGIIFFFLYFGDLFSQYFSGGLLNLNGYLLDTRGLVQVLFFENLTGDKVFWGYPIDFEYYLDYTSVYNMFLLNYNYTTILGFAIIILLFLIRFIKSKKYFFNILFLLPILFYGLVEEIFLPKGWDFILFLVLFLKVKSPKSSLNKKSINE
tara:strand:+ start:4313 stop:5356 length:1044 start_codon:yes stop_codon:yes gene_type:complete